MRVIRSNLVLRRHVLHTNQFYTTSFMPEVHVHTLTYVSFEHVPPGTLHPKSNESVRPASRKEDTKILITACTICVGKKTSSLIIRSGKHTSATGTHWNEHCCVRRC